MPQHVYLWHPIFVHFTLALWFASVLFYLAARLAGNAAWRARLLTAAELNLWAGTTLTVLTVGFGLLAYESVPHEDSAHEIMQLHRNLALVTFGWFASLAVISRWHRTRGDYPSVLFVTALLVGLAGLTLTGMRGGELVFKHGLGVERARDGDKIAIPAENSGAPHHDASLPESPYARQQSRPVKALSAQEVEDYREGRGMGTSKVAELNHYPGPRHVIDAAQQLGLTHEQLEKAKAIYTAMSESAKAIGRRIVAKESELEALFAGGKATADNTRSIVGELGALQASFRFAHLNAHLATLQILKPEQLVRYDALRGYGVSPSGHEKHPHDH